ncbi:MAG TPA: hypothetical protein VH254_04550 [Candidatus Udaeobacter sp.]|nr:hypothetical protein [Candidatus Udaeobacter sp.]
MMLDDQGMAEEWIVRVQGKEYGPADIETLREWKSEGRLLPDNEVRSDVENLWSTAAAIPGLFDVAPVVPSAGRVTQEPLQLHHRSFGQILAGAFQIYRKGFFQFLCLTLLVFLPSLLAQLAAAATQTTQTSTADLGGLAAASFGLLMFILSLVMWPIYIGAIQILSVEIAAGRPPSLVAALNQAVRFWPRIAALCIFVYGIFFLLIVFGLVIAAITMAGASSILLILFALALLILQVWMFGRFFVNVLFWQQFAVLENAGFIESLRESRNLARGGHDFPWFQRPLWRGALIASLWLTFVLAITLISEWATVRQYFSQILTTHDPQSLLRQLTEAQQAQGIRISGLGASVLQRILQPLLGIAFVVLYLDGKIEPRR